MRRSNRAPVWTATLVATFVLAPRTAVASRDFPGAVQQALDLPCAPGCRLCHNDDRGGPGNLPAGESFAASLYVGGGGLSPGDKSSVAGALDWARETGLDSDHDGVPDIEELEGGETGEPRYPRDDAPLCAGPKYGCGARVEPRGTLEGTAALAAAVVSLVAFRRRRRRVRSR